MDEQANILETPSVPTTSTPEEALKHIADEAVESLPAEAVREISSAEPVILLFDEADSLFGKRSTVKDSHDRYGKS